MTIIIITTAAAAAAAEELAHDWTPAVSAVYAHPDRT